MLEFSDAAYRFFGPDPSPALIRLGRWFNQHFVLPGRNHRIEDIEISGDDGSLRFAQKQGKRLLFVANHPTHSDPQVLTELHRRMGISSCFMAAYDVFLRGKIQGKLMQKMGAFSIDREGSDRKALNTAIGILKSGDMALNIFPEGNVYLSNDRVTPFLEGTAFIALKAQKSLPVDEEIAIVPVSLKYTHIRDPRDDLADLVRELAKQAGVEEKRSEESSVDFVVRLGRHMLSSHLSKHGYGASFRDAESIFEDLSDIEDTLISELERELDLAPAVSETAWERVRKVRSTIHQLRTQESRDDSEDARLSDLADRAILTFRIAGYLQPYLLENETIDRYSETVERLREDYFSRSFPPIKTRKVYAKIHQPILPSQFLEEAQGKLRDAVAPLTAMMEESVQTGIDELCADNVEIGGQRLSA